MAAEFRPAGPDDADAVHKLRQAFYREDGSSWAEEPARTALATLLQAPAYGRVWVAVDAGVAVGYVVLTFGYSLEFCGRDAFVDELYLQPLHRGRGLGGIALALVEAACRESAVRALHLEVDATNEAARALYRTWGFVEHTRQLMTKWLPPEPAAPPLARRDA